MNEEFLTQKKEGWELALKHYHVNVDFTQWATKLTFEHQENKFEVQSEGPLLLNYGNGEHTSVGLNPTRLERKHIIEIIRNPTDTVFATYDGCIKMLFTNGSSIFINASKMFEAWSLAGPCGLRLVSMPGGELVIWKPK